MVRRNAAAGEAMEVAVPDIEQAQAHRQVAFKRRGAKVFVHLVGAGQKLPEALRTNGNCQRQANCRPHRVSPANPVPKPKRGADTKGVGGCHVGGERREMSRDVAAAIRFKPGLGGLRVGHGLDRGESLAGNQKQRAGGLDALQNSGQFMAIDVGDKVKALAWQHKAIQRQHGHLRAEVRAANANVDDVGDGRVSPHGLCIGQHGIQRGVHPRQFKRHGFNRQLRLDFGLGWR